MNEDVFTMDLSNNITLKSVGNNLKQYIYGSFTLAIIAAMLFGALSYISLKVFKRKKITGNQVV